MIHRYDVLGIGIAAVDDLLYVEEYPQPDCKIPVHRSIRQGGGPACTATAAIGALGGSAAYVAQFGDNDLSRFIKNALECKSVDTSHLFQAPAAGPYHSVIVVDSRGHRNVFYNASLYQTVQPNQLPDELLQSASLVLIDHITEPSLLPVAEQAHRLGVPLLGDIEGCTKTAKDLAALMDYLVVPKTWALWASGCTQPADACRSLASTTRRATVVTDSVHGCYYKTSEDGPVLHYPAFAVHAFDTNGCGDSFHGAFGLAVARHLAINDAVVFATAVAALKARAGDGQRRGWEALPSFAEVFLFLLQTLKEPERSAVLPRLHSLGAVLKGDE